MRYCCARAPLHHSATATQQFSSLLTPPQHFVAIEKNLADYHSFFAALECAPAEIPSIAVRQFSPASSLGMAGKALIGHRGCSASYSRVYARSPGSNAAAGITSKTNHVDRSPISPPPDADLRCSTELQTRPACCGSIYPALDRQSAAFAMQNVAVQRRLAETAAHRSECQPAAPLECDTRFVLTSRPCRIPSLCRDPSAGSRRSRVTP